MASALQGLRKRVSSAMAAPQSAIQQFDAYAKPMEDFKVKTASGAIITLASLVVIGILLASEFIDWQTVGMQPSLQVDVQRQERMDIHLDITFPRLPCYVITVDVMDVAGEQQNDIEHTMVKTRLDPKGNPVASPAPSQLGAGHIEEVHDAINRTQAEGYCGSCYGANMPPSGCCNTCEEVKAAYIRSKWSFSAPEKMEQCVREHWAEKMAEQAHEGCSITGMFAVNKVEGNFHVAPGKSFQQGSAHIHDIQEFQKLHDLDMSHTIHHLSFGKSSGGPATSRYFSNPLSQVEKHTGSAHFVYEYFLKVVATTITYLNGSVLETNQYSVTEHEQDVSSPFGPRKVPGVFFHYQISPMLVQYQQYKKPFTHFLTDVCSIVGGVFTVAGLLDSFVYNAERAYRQKNGIGKAT